MSRRLMSSGAAPAVSTMFGVSCVSRRCLFRDGQPRNDEVAEGGLNLLAAAGSAMGAVLRESRVRGEGRVCVCVAY